jgi:hypothetical protein
MRPIQGAADKTGGVAALPSRARGMLGDGISRGARRASVCAAFAPCVAVLGTASVNRVLHLNEKSAYRECLMARTGTQAAIVHCLLAPVIEGSTRCQLSSGLLLLRASR